METANNEVLRYLGYLDDGVDERIASHIEEMVDLLSANIIPQSICRIWDCQVNTGEVTLGGMTVYSQDLARHLAGCRRAVLLAATLGTEADAMIRRYSVQDMEKALVAQAVCAAMIEEYCDKIEIELARRPEFEGLYPVTRFSPGYGDFDITYQKDILNMLNSRRIGLTLTDGYMLAPSKSTTAVIGFSPEKKSAEEKCKRGKCCESCPDTQCKFRKAEG